MKINIYFFIQNLHIYTQTISHVEPHEHDYIVIIFVFFRVKAGQMSVPAVRMPSLSLVLR